MKRIAKKKALVKRTAKTVDRSKAAKKGWATRRRNEREAKKESKTTKYERDMARLNQELKRAKAQAARDRSKIRMLQEKQKQQRKKKEEFSPQELKAIAHEAGERMSTVEVLNMLTADERRQAQKDIINARMDRALKLYGDVRYDAWVLSEELDMDIGDIYDAWDYEEGSAS
jgi:hypothetical protein